MLPSAHRSPLTRHPLGRLVSLAFVITVALPIPVRGEKWPGKLPAGATQAVLLHQVEATPQPLPADYSSYGILILKLVVEADGKVGPVKVVRGLHPIVDTAWIEAVKEWRYQPAYLNGKPIRSSLTVTITAHPERWPRVTPTRGAG